ncbi:hypothetical protein BaRGS_00033764, partial [Batillaria attramentaria]
MGWFVPSSCVEEMWEENNRAVDHWRSLLITSVARMFSWWGRPEWRALCPGCEAKAYRSLRCSRRRKNCATLFSSFRGLDGGLLEQQIETLDLPVDIVWMGGALEQFVMNQTAHGQHILFFSWHPSKLTLGGNFTRISFPEWFRHSSDTSSREPFRTEFQVNQFSKVAWYRIKAGAPDAYHVITKMSLPQQTYYELMNAARTSNQSDPEKIACSWVRENRDVWEAWLPPTFTAKPKLFLAGLFPLSGRKWPQPGLVQGAQLAVDLVNADNETLPAYDLSLIVNDTQCQPDVAMNDFIQLMLKQDHSFKMIGILGPACSDAAEPIAALSRHFHAVMVSYGAEAASLSNRQIYPYFFRTIPQVTHYRYVYADFFKAMGWNKVGALAEGGQELPEYHLELQTYLHQQGISVLVMHKMQHDPQQMDLSQVFRELREQNVRVIIADFYGSVARAVMCEAFHKKMTAHDGYVWFLPSWYGPDWWDVDFYNSPTGPSDPRPQESVPCSTEDMEYAIDGHFIVANRFTDQDDQVVEGGITVRQYKEMYAERAGKAYVEESPFASFVYDAVWVFAKGLHRLLAENPAALDTLNENKTARDFVAAINKTKFRGVSGPIHFNGSDRQGVVTIQQFFRNETLLVGRYESDEAGKKVFRIDSDKIRWLSPVGMRPDLINSGEWYDAKVRATHERMKELGFLSSDYSHCLTLDEWEIPRKNVVLNRKLGEGAFGTVCGGEMMMEGEGWVAVAVKTLKIRHSMEEKLDFFSEVGMMKRFRHPNIVPLLGVCTRSEPVYAVMEFQLHGDLKTYLLSRRNLVGQAAKEAEDVSPENLTKMAIDIASGLQYLHQLKYVHRDLACRNCLVHANKTVKISDFGMTRHISDSDYYRFSRKGMLPVRWMSPESLVDGIFTFKSDIWSFGVLVYEIVTFGSFPYQGLSNTQVLEYVKQGNRLTLPDQCPDDLRSFIHWCMFYDQGFRPDLEDILDYLHYNQKFLVPCLDAPMSSVVMEDTDSLEMALPSCQTTLTPSNTQSHLQRRSGSWQDKLASAARKTFSVPGFSNKSANSKYTKTLFATTVPMVDRVRSNSISAMQSPSAMDALLAEEDMDLRRTNSCQKQLSSVGTSEQGDSGERGDSDYFSDNSKELCQTITTV